VARKYSVFCGKPVKVEIAKTGTYASTVWKLSFVWIQRQTETSVSILSHTEIFIFIHA
jgi:hypothetical protein